MSSLTIVNALRPNSATSGSVLSVCWGAFGSGGAAEHRARLDASKKAPAQAALDIRRISLLLDSASLVSVDIEDPPADGSCFKRRFGGVGAMLERSRFMVGDAAWEKIAPLLPGKASDPGATARDNRLFLEAVLWRVRTGMPWRDPPRGFGHRNSGFPRFRPLGKGGGFSPAFEI